MWRLGVLALAVAVAGCAGADARRDRPSAEQRLRRQRWSEAAQEAIEGGDWATARGLLEGLIAEAPRSAEAHQRLGRVLEAQGAIDGAAWAYRRALGIEPEYPEALCGLARVELAAGR